MREEGPSDRAQKGTPRRGHGEGGIRKRPDGRWEATVDLGYQVGPGGKKRRVRKFAYGRTRREVARKLDDLRDAAREGLPIASERLNVGAYLDQWLEQAAPARGARTMARYATVVRLYLKPRLGAIRLSQLGPQHVERLQRDLLAAGPAPRTVIKLREHQRRQEEDRLKAGARWQEMGLVFSSTIGTPMEPRNLNRAWYSLRRRIGIPDLKLHGLRHSATSLYLALGVPPHVVQAIIGHADPTVTMSVYAHVSDADRRQAARLMDRAILGEE